MGVEVANTCGGILVVLCDVLPKQVGTNTRRDARSHGVLSPEARPQLFLSAIPHAPALAHAH
jgi:hypothetical protein